MSAQWSLNLSSVRNACAPPLRTGPSITPSHDHPPSTTLAFCLSQLLLFNAVWHWSLEIAWSLVMWKHCVRWILRLRIVSVYWDVDGFIEVRCDEVWLGENVMDDWKRTFVSRCLLPVSDLVVWTSHWHLVSAGLWWTQMYCVINGKKKKKRKRVDRNSTGS